MKTTFVILALVFSAPSALAQIDVANILVGTWEGQVSPTKGKAQAPLERALVIKSVAQTGDGWTAAARYGITGRRLADHSLSVSVRGGEVEVEFLTSANPRVRLRLFSSKHLIGTIVINQEARELKFQKID